MNLGLLGRLVARRGWLVLAGAALGAAAGLALAAATTPVYGAVTRVKVQPARPADLGQTQAIREIMRSYMRDIRTYDMAAAVRARLCGDMSELGRSLCATLDDGAIRAMTEVGADENVFEIRIKARSQDPAAAVKISEQTAHAFLDQREKANRELLLRERILVAVREAPRPVLDAPRRKLYVAGMAALGAALGAALALALEFVERAAVLDARDAARASGAGVLVMVPAAEPRRGRRRRRAAPLSGGPARAAGALRHLLPILLLAVLGAAAALAFSRAQTPLYVARTRIAVEPALGSDWGQSLAIREITRGFSEDIRTREMASAVNERLQMDLPSDALLEKVHVAPDVDVYEIVIEAFDPDPGVAAEVSRGWAGLFVEQRTQANLALDQRDRILTRLRDRSEVEAWAPKTTTNVLAGALIGALVGAAAAYFLVALRAGLVRTREEASDATGGVVLAQIPPAHAAVTRRSR